MDKQELLKRIPKIDEVLKDQRLFLFFEDTPRELVVDAVREAINEVRERILAGQKEHQNPESDSLIDDIINRIGNKKQLSLRRVINGTGTILHTNLGRARLSDGTCKNAVVTAANYSTLEYDLKNGTRGSRHDHIDKLITKILGTEAAMVVNNNAAAVLLCLSALAKDKEVVVSRGELVEIGGSFRIPEIMELGGARLKEVGTTNKTKLADYMHAIDPEKTGMLLKVHTSNYKIVGFTAEVPLAELAELGRKHKVPVVHDLGSGLMTDLRAYGVDEPTIYESIRAGADVVLFSGDKLLGGPQAGIITGKKEYIEQMKEHPLARVVRVDKMTLAALETTFREYFDMERAKRNIPVLSMITVSMEEMKNKANLLAEKVSQATGSFELFVEKSEGQVGGGSTPNLYLQGYALYVKGVNVSPDRIERDLRGFRDPIIVRIHQDRVLIDMRTVDVEELDLVAEALIACGSKYETAKDAASKRKGGKGRDA